MGPEQETGMSDLNEAWLILVPTEKPAHFVGKHRFFRTRYHKLWDAKVLAISNGLTIWQPTKGYWVSSVGELFKEGMIPVEINCNRAQIERIIDITAKHYGQQAIYARKVSEEVLLIHFDTEGKRCEGRVAGNNTPTGCNDVDLALQGQR
jgi:hypothetical protein